MNHWLYEKVRNDRSSYGGGYVSHADSARLIREMLKAKFPNTKFWVRSESYSMGSAVRVYYDGIDRIVDNWPARSDVIYKAGAPNSKDVETVIGVLGGADFDGMIDMQFSHDAFLMPDGSVIYGGTRGTSGSRGSYAPVTVDAPTDGIKVHFGSWLTVTANKPYGVK